MWVNVTCPVNASMGEDDCCRAMECTPPASWLPVEFVLVVCLGGITAVLSIIENVILLLVFLSKEQLVSTYFFLTVLAGLDILMGVFYISLMIVRVLSEYMIWIPLNKAWYSYVAPVFTVSHITMTSSAVLLIFATFERYRGADSLNKFPFTQGKRVVLALLAIGVGTGIKGSLFFEFQIDHRPRCVVCNPIGELSIGYTPMAQSYWYATIWMFWFRNIAVVFLPFFVLCYLNFGIVLALRRQTLASRQLIVCPELVEERVGNGELGGLHNEVRVRAATRMLFIVSGSYIIANVMNVIITAWEHIDVASLLSANAEFYHLAAATVSLLTILAGALRLPSYSWCNPELRAVIRDFLCGRPKEERPPYDARNPSYSEGSPHRGLLNGHWPDPAPLDHFHTLAALSYSTEDVML